MHRADDSRPAACQGDVILHCNIALLVVYGEAILSSPIKGESACNAAHRACTLATNE